MTTSFAGEADHHLQFLGCILHKLELDTKRNVTTNLLTRLINETLPQADFEGALNQSFKNWIVNDDIRERKDKSIEYSGLNTSSLEESINVTERTISYCCKIKKKFYILLVF